MLRLWVSLDGEIMPQGHLLSLVFMTAPDPIKLDLRGIKCPLNWAHAKVRLEQMERGQVLELMLDDPRGYRDIPSAAEAEGHAILATDARADGTFILKIEK